MRFAIYITLLVAVLPLVFTRPFFGLCVYYVVSLLDPKLLCWNPTFQDAFLVGIPLVIGAIAIGVHRFRPQKAVDERTNATSIQWVRERSAIFEFAWPLIVLLVLIVYIAINRVISGYPLENSSTQFRNLCKIALVACLLTGLASDQRRFRIFYLVVALSVGFWAIKGGLKMIFMGPHRVYGKTFDNNLFALTSVMVLPMLFYFGQSLRSPRWRMAAMIGSGLICLAIIGAQSRAGFLALAVVLTCMAWSSRYRVRAALAAGLLALAALLIAGPQIKERIASIAAYETDRSALARFFTWEVARDMFLEHPLAGVGFGNYETVKKERTGDRKAAHNIYLQNAAELGLIGHGLWLLLLFGSMISLYRCMRRARGMPAEFRWGYYYSRGLLLGLLGFCIHGIFHNEDFLELMLTMVAMNVALQTALYREIRASRVMKVVGHPTTSRLVGNADATAKRPAPLAVHPGRLFGRRVVGVSS